MICALCGKALLRPAVMIGSEAIGPKCARRAGLTRLASQSGSRVIRFGRPPKQSEAIDDKTLDLFADGGGSETAPQR